MGKRTQAKLHLQILLGEKGIQETCKLFNKSFGGKSLSTHTKFTYTEQRHKQWGQKREQDHLVPGVHGLERETTNGQIYCRT